MINKDMPMNRELRAAHDTHSGMKFQGEPFKHIQKGFATFYPFMWQMIIFLFRIPRNATICSLQKVRGSITFHQTPKKASLINQLLVKKISKKAKSKPVL